MFYKDYSKEIARCKHAILKVKTRLVIRAERVGLWENFGQKEMRRLNDDYFQYVYECDKIRYLLNDFNDWATNYTGR